MRAGHGGPSSEPINCKWTRATLTSIGPNAWPSRDGLGMALSRAFLGIEHLTQNCTLNIKVKKFNQMKGVLRRAPAKACQCRAKACLSRVKACQGRALAHAKVMSRHAGSCQGVLRHAKIVPRRVRHAKVVPELCHGVPRSCQGRVGAMPSHAKAVPKPCQGNVKAYSGYVKAVLESCQGHAKVVSKHAKLVLKAYQGMLGPRQRHAKVLPRLAKVCQFLPWLAKVMFVSRHQGHAKALRPYQGCATTVKAPLELGVVFPSTKDLVVACMLRSDRVGSPPGMRRRGRREWLGQFRMAGLNVVHAKSWPVALNLLGEMTL
ncbi:hypothetical protein Syun_017517 [Stephania yunnanensis]|uniref:Uncharacterized protein n=1 Tax=Stephania yunnanensis TaxID=152371 RepID=A0AAP0J806_9MAGN